MRHLKQCMAMILSVVMMVTLLPSSPMEKVEAAPADSLLAEYRFEESALVDGKIKDAAGNGYDAALEGEGAKISGGILNLPGGGAGSKAAYVSIPGRLFENRDTVTITAWLRNETGAGDYTAMYFGTTTKHIGGGTADRPLHYWILNPMNPKGYFKSVWTDGDNADTPYSTETAVSSAATSADWGLYTTVITPDRIIGYYNGVEVCNNKKTKKTSDFGTGLIACIGRSAYNDKFYQGGVYGVRVYDAALTAAEIKAQYENDASPLLIQDKADLVIEPTVTKDLTLPLKGSQGSEIAWKSSNPDVISNDGKVNIPVDQDAKVTLTATLSLNGKTDTKEFALTVPAVSLKQQFENRVDGFTLGRSVVWSDLELPDTLGKNTENVLDKNTKITWSSSDRELIDIVISGKSMIGKVKRPGPDAPDAMATLTAKFTYKNGGDQFSREKSFELKVRAEESYGYLMSYTNTKENASLGNSLHLAYSRDGKSFTALNSNTGICFAVNTHANKNTNPNGLQGMYIFRKLDGTYGMAARNVSTQNYIYIFDSDNLVDFTNERTLTLGMDVTGDLQVVPVQGTSSYEIFWKSKDKKYKAATTDFKTVSDVQETEYTKETVSADCQPPEGASVGNIIGVSKSEYEFVVNKLGVVRNTGMRTPEVEMNVGVSQADAAAMLPETVTAEYSDGSTADMRVSWNSQELAGMDFSKEGTYEVTGTVQQTQYVNPFIEQRADPCILKGNDGYYYFTASYPVRGNSDREGYDRIVLRRSETIEGLAKAEEVTIWHCNDSASQFRYIWAPEIRLVNDQYYVFYTASVDSSSTWGIRPQVLKCTNPADIMNPASWEEKGRMIAKSGDMQSFGAFSLDMTVFEHQGRWYVIWAQTIVASSLLIAEIDPNEPWKCISEGKVLAVPRYSWERQVENVNEGPSVIKNNGKIYVAFSAAGTGPEYCVGLLSIDEDQDLLNVDNWKKQGYPVLTSSDVPGEFGPGHNSFTVDEYGNPIFVYHARGQQCYERKCQWASSSSLNDPCRDARLKRVHWAADGSPILKMSYEEELAEENKTVKAVINVRVKAEQITLNKNALSLKVGASEILTAAITPENVSDKTVVWTSDNTKVAEVKDGRVTAKAAGKAAITASTSNGKTAVCTVTVKDIVKVKKVTLNKTKLTLGSGESFKLKATVNPGNAENKTVSWTTSNKKVVAAPKNGAAGKITAKKVKKPTTVTITAKAGDKKAVCKVTVKPAPKKITLNAKKKTLKKGKTFRLKVKMPKNTASTITYKSSNKKVASVNAGGRVKALKKGKATITAKSHNGKKASVKITVK